MELEDFIKSQRAAFEQEGPSPRLWEQLEKQLPVKRKAGVVRLLGRHWLKAAAVLLLVANSFLLMQFLQFKKQQSQGVVIPELDEAGVYYTNQIEERLELIGTFPKTSLDLDSTAQRELSLKNDTYQMLEKELQRNPGNERIRAAMIRYYKMKLELLDKIIEAHEEHSTNKQYKQYESQI
jgi:hypothetical protein